MAKILVTGGAGFIGSHIVDTYIKEGHDVVIVDNLASGSLDNLNPQATFYETDIRSPELVEIFEREKPEYVNHLAAQIDVRRSVEEPMFDAEVNVLGSINLLEASIKHGIKKFLFASTGGAIYGDPEILPAPEECPPHPKCHYATSKLSFEHYLDLYRLLYNLRYTILRFPNVYGPRQNAEGEAGVCSILIGMMLRGKTPTLFGFGEPLRDYVYVGDIARANVLALEKGDGEIINLGSGKGTSVREIFDVLKDLLNFQEEPILKPLRPGEVQNSYITGDKAKQILAWEPQMELKEGLRRTLEHIQNN
jgi:UDP-glucose 4-epimerase